MLPREIAESLVEIRQQDTLYHVYLLRSRIDPDLRDHHLCLAYDDRSAEALRWTWVNVLTGVIRHAGQQALVGNLKLEEAYHD